MNIALTFQEATDLLVEALEMKGRARLNPSTTKLRVLHADEGLFIVLDEEDPKTPEGQ